MSELQTPVRSSLTGRRSILIFLAFLLAFVTFLVYLPTLKNGFVLWDDPKYVYENLSIRTIDLAFFKWVATAVVVSNWHPLTVLSHAIDYRLWGLDPWGHHLTSMLFHSVNTALFFLLTIRLIEFGSRGARGFTRYTLVNPAVLLSASMAALLFGLHPIHVESVSWVSERKDVLSALFFMLTTYFYLGYVGARGGKRTTARRHYAFALAACVLALMSKPMAVSLPVVLLILDYYPLERLPGAHGWAKGIRRVIVEKVPFILLAGASSVMTLWAQKTGGSILPLDIVPLSIRIPLAFRSYLFYLYKLVIPDGLAPIYIHPLSENSFFSLEYLLPLLLFCVITFIFLVLLRRWKIFTAVWCYYLITLLPVIGIVQVGRQVAADRYAYLPGLAPTLLAAIGFGLFYERCKRKGLRTVTLSAGIVVLLVFSVITVKQESIWRNTISFWTRQVLVYPSTRSYASRAEAYRREEMYERAVQDYTSAIEIGSDNIDPSEIYNNRGNAYNAMNEVDAAFRDYSMALTINPWSLEAYNNRGNIYRNAGQYALAVRDFKAAIKIAPSTPILYLNLGLAYAGAGKRHEALSELEMASRMGLNAANEVIRRFGLEQ
jgi:hypothetical protein